MHPFTVAKKVLASLGIRAYRTGNLPRGLDVLADLKQINFHPEVIFDVGANVGKFTQLAVDTFASSAIYSFEPIESTFKSLQEVAARNPRVHAYKMAFGAEKGTATVHLRANSVWNSLLPYNNDPRNSSGVSETISIDTVNAFCAGNNITKIDLLKTDTEGFDANVLAGASRMFQEGCVRAVYSEITFSDTDHTHTPFLDILNFLKPLDFVLYGVYEFGGDLETGHANALFVRKQNK